MRQAGIFASAGIFALKNMIDGLNTDHANAKKIAHNLANIKNIKIDLKNIKTNIIFFYLEKNGLSDDEFIRIAGSHVEALNYALSGVPKEKVRVHICWGNYEGPHVCDIPMSKMFDTLMNIKGKYFLF